MIVESSLALQLGFELKVVALSVIWGEGGGMFSFINAIQLIAEV